MLAQIGPLPLVLGGTMEQSFRQALAISDGNPRVFLSSWISAGLIGLTALSLVLPPLLRQGAWLRQRFRAA